MNIPESTIRPFEPHGMPKLSLLSDTIDSLLTHVYNVQSDPKENDLDVMRKMIEAIYAAGVQRVSTASLNYEDEGINYIMEYIIRGKTYRWEKMKEISWNAEN